MPHSLPGFLPRQSRGTEIALPSIMKNKLSLLVGLLVGLAFSASANNGGIVAPTPPGTGGTTPNANGGLGPYGAPGGVPLPIMESNRSSQSSRTATPRPSVLPSPGPSTTGTYPNNSTPVPVR